MKVPFHNPFNTILSKIKTGIYIDPDERYYKSPFIVG